MKTSVRCCNDTINEPHSVAKRKKILIGDFIKKKYFNEYLLDLVQHPLIFLDLPVNTD